MMLPIRVRLALLASAMVALLIAGLGLFVFLRLEQDLRDAVDEGLRSRAEILADELANRSTTDPIPPHGDTVAQVLTRDGRVLVSSENLVPGPVLAPEMIATLRGTRFIDVELQSVEGPLPGRVLAMPLADDQVLVVGDPVEDQRDALSVFRVLLGVGGAVAVGLAAAVGWLIAGAALRPVERMRIAAETISGTAPGRRLPEAGTGDELARLGTSLNAMLDRLEAAVERERRFVDDASHELRTPLANLKAELDLALRAPRSPQLLLDALRSAAEETDRLARLAEDLLVLARAEGGRLPVRRIENDVAAIVRDAVGGFAGRAAELGIELVVSAAVERRASVDGDRIRQAVSNLVDNALRHTPRGGQVTVELTRLPDEVAIRVADTGDGFPADFIPRAFEAFSRADPARSRGGGGTGLGLAIVQAVAEAHDGSVGAWNRVEGGAEIVVRLPV